jgi:antitoxin (DNA-binding transcriptional repressor) of toxin-antitoxin stability system
VSARARIAKAGKPCARLVPLEAPPERRPGRYHERVPDSFFEPLTEAELEAWES